MAERRLTTDELLSGLQGIRLPPDAPGGLVAEIAAAVGVGLLIALGVSTLLPLITRRTSRKSAPSLHDRIEDTRSLPADDRVVALLHLMKEQKPAFLKTLKNRIYAPGELPDPQMLESELKRETHD